MIMIFVRGYGSWHTSESDSAVLGFIFYCGEKALSSITSGRRGYTGKKGYP